MTQTILAVDTPEIIYFEINKPDISGKLIKTCGHLVIDIDHS